MTAQFSAPLRLKIDGVGAILSVAAALRVGVGGLLRRASSGRETRGISNLDLGCWCAQLGAMASPKAVLFSPEVSPKLLAIEEQESRPECFEEPKARPECWAAVRQRAPQWKLQLA